MKTKFLLSIALATTLGLGAFEIQTMPDVTKRISPAESSPTSVQSYLIPSRMQ